MSMTAHIVPSGELINAITGAENEDDIRLIDWRGDSGGRDS
jgi:hypothetical protein